MTFVCIREKRERDKETDTQRHRYRDRETKDRHTQRVREGHMFAVAHTHSAQVEIRHNLEGVGSYFLSCVETDSLLFLLLWTSGRLAPHMRGWSSPPPPRWHRNRGISDVHNHIQLFTRSLRSLTQVIRFVWEVLLPKPFLCPPTL